MKKSKMLKDFAQNKIELETILKQLKLLLVDLEKDELVKWIDYEIEGYPTSSEVPKYREYPGILKGSFLNYGAQCKNVPIPLKSDTPEIVKESTRKVAFREGVSALKKLKESSGSVYASIPGDLLISIQQCAAVSMTYLMKAEIEVSDTVPYSILSAIENKVMDILLLLEKEFGSLDELYLDLTGKDNDEIEKIANNITIIIYDKHVEIGNDNVIKNSKING